MRRLTAPRVRVPFPFVVLCACGTTLPGHGALCVGGAPRRWRGRRSLGGESGNCGERGPARADSSDRLRLCAYGQVWRDGLYLTLYSMGVRGAMWHIIQEWLNNARACTTWNGVRGPTVKLEEGLRQGCVLSPILHVLYLYQLLCC